MKHFESELNQYKTQFKMMQPGNEKLSSLAEASPETIKYLKKIGSDGALAQQEYLYIKNNEHLYLYYISFLRTVVSAVQACTCINSEMISNSSQTSAEKVTELINNIASNSSVPGCFNFYFF